VIKVPAVVVALSDPRVGTPSCELWLPASFREGRHRSSARVSSELKY